MRGTINYEGCIGDYQWVPSSEPNGMGKAAAEVTYAPGGYVGRKYAEHRLSLWLR